MHRRICEVETGVGTSSTDDATNRRSEMRYQQLKRVLGDGCSGEVLPNLSNGGRVRRPHWESG